MPKIFFFRLYSPDLPGIQPKVFFDLPEFQAYSLNLPGYMPVPAGHIAQINFFSGIQPKILKSLKFIINITLIANKSIPAAHICLNSSLSQTEYWYRVKNSSNKNELFLKFKLKFCCVETLISKLMFKVTVLNFLRLSRQEIFFKFTIVSV